MAPPQRCQPDRVFLGTKLAVPSLRERGRTSPHGSAIVNLASVAGLGLAARPALFDDQWRGHLVHQVGHPGVRERATVSVSTRSTQALSRPIWASRLRWTPWLSERRTEAS